MVLLLPYLEKGPLLQCPVAATPCCIFHSIATGTKALHNRSFPVSSVTKSLHFSDPKHSDFLTKLSFFYLMQLSVKLKCIGEGVLPLHSRGSLDSGSVFCV